MSAVRAAGFVLHDLGPSGQVVYLVLRSADGGHWGFAKGHLEPGEHLLSGALREVEEETGLVPALDPAFVHEIAYEVPAAGGRRAHAKTVTYFLGAASRGALRVSSEHDAAEWVPLGAALERLAHESLREVLRRADGFRAARSGRAAGGRA